MTQRLRTIVRPARGVHASSEDRQQFLVTAGFVALIVAVVVIVVAALGIGYYNDHLKPIATVGGAQITQDDWIERSELTTYRLRRAEREVRQNLAAGEITQEVYDARIESLRTATGDAPSQAIEDLIDLTYQGQLAAARGLAITDQEVDAAMAKEASTPERRRVLAIFVEPERDSASAEPTAAQSRDALARAEEALAALESGTPFDEVAREYSTDISRENGGEYGVITDNNPTDGPWVQAVFELEEGGTTEVVKGLDGVFRIGRVTEILPGSTDPTYDVERREEGVSDAAFRENVSREVLAEKLRDEVVAEATSGEVEQVRLSEIVILGSSAAADPATDQGEVRASHILYSPNDDPSGAADLPADDPAWAAAEGAARAADAELRAIEDVEEREEAFAEKAREESDDTVSGEQGGDLGFFARDVMLAEFADPLFDMERTPGEIVGPVRTEVGYHVILFQERRGPASERIATVLDELEADDADFAAIAREHSDGDEAEDGGDIGWVVRGQLPEEAEEAVFALDAGEVTDSIEQEDGFHVYKVEEKATRPLDAEQRSIVEQNAFSEWYDPQKEAAEESGVIVRDPAVFGDPGEIVDGEPSP